MELLLLPGNHPSIREWTEEIELVLRDYFDSTQIMDYLHWKVGRSLISLDEELPRLSGYLNDRNYAILAKSVGILLATRAVKEKILDPKFCIFIGTPVTRAKELGFEIEEMFNRYQVPTLFIQNDQDPVGTGDKVKKFLREQEVENYKFVELSGLTHDYDEIDILRKKIGLFISSNKKL